MDEDEVTDVITSFWEEASDEYQSFQEEVREDHGIEEVGRTDPQGNFKVETEEHSYRVNWANREIVEFDGKQVEANPDMETPEEFEDVRQFISKLYNKVSELNDDFVDTMEEQGFEVVDREKAYIAFSNNDIHVSCRPWATEDGNVKVEKDFEPETGVDPSTINALVSAEINDEAIKSQFKQYLQAWKNGRITEEKLDRKIDQLVDQHTNIRLNSDYEMAELRSEGMPIRRNTYHDALTVVHDYEVGKFVMFGDQKGEFEDVDGQRVLGVVDLPKKYSEHALHGWNRQDDKALDEAEKEILEYMGKPRWLGIKEHGEKALKRISRNEDEDHGE